MICHISVGYHIELRVIIILLLKRISFLIKRGICNPLMCIIAIYVIWAQNDILCKNVITANGNLQ